jgi:hypothetical protein
VLSIAFDRSNANMGEAKILITNIKSNHARNEALCGCSFTLANFSLTKAKIATYKILRPVYTKTRAKENAPRQKPLKHRDFLKKSGD